MTPLTPALSLRERGIWLPVAASKLVAPSPRPSPLGRKELLLPLPEGEGGGEGHQNNMR